MKTHATLNFVQAKKEIGSFFKQYGICVNKPYNKISKGKIYELYCLSRVVEQLKKYGYNVSIQSRFRSIDFKASPGKIDRNKSYFTAHARNGVVFEIHTNIEVMTLGIDLNYSNLEHQDLSAYHEIDIVVIEQGLSGRPRYNQLILGVECKADAHFRKPILKQVLGIRRELSLLSRLLPSKLAQAVGKYFPEIRANPNSEYWLAYIDPKGDRYKASPATFGIKFNNWRP